MKPLSYGEIIQLTEDGEFSIKGHRYFVENANIYALLWLSLRIDRTHSITLPLREGNMLLAVASHLAVRIKNAKQEILAANKSLPTVALKSVTVKEVDIKQLTDDALRFNTNKALIKGMRKPSPQNRQAPAKRVGRFTCPCGKVFYREAFRVNKRAREGYVFCGKTCQYKYLRKAQSKYNGLGWLNQSNEFVLMDGYK